MGWNSVEYWHNILSSDRSDSEPDHLTSEADIWDSEPDTRASETKTWVSRSVQGDSETNRWNEESDNQASETDHQSTYHWDPILNSRSSEPDRSFSKPNHWSAGPPFRRQIRMGRPSTYVFDSYGDTCITLYTSKDRTFSFSGDTLSNVTSDEVSREEDDCPHACSSLMLGRLTKKIYNFDSNGLGSQAFLGWLSIEGCIRDIKSMGDSDLSDWNCRHPSTIFQRLYPALQNAENQLPAFYLKGRMLTVEQEPTVQSEPNPYAHNEDNW
ncbi:unnamed protein product [Fusarium graminearum]|nr:unnamed protein product [Fusarium graminearum]